MTIHSRGRWAAIALSGLLAACAGDGIGGIFGGDNDDGDRGSGAQRAAVDACVEAADERDWTVLDTYRARPSGVNDVQVEMRVRQDDGDVRDIECIYDTGSEDARLVS